MLEKCSPRVKPVLAFAVKNSASLSESDSDKVTGCSFPLPLIARERASTKGRDC